MESLTPAQQELFDWLVEYIDKSQHAPSIREMMHAMHLRSPAPVQSRLERLRNKGYIDWIEGKARTIRILRPKLKGIRILGTITVGTLVELCANDQTELDLSEITEQKNYYGLQIVGDSMIEDLIIEGDLAIMRSLPRDEYPKDGEIVAAIVEGHGTTLKRFYQNGEKVLLKPSNSQSKPIEVKISEVEIQGVLVGVWRAY
ncbi:transcriptional repressor LexA [cyanobacterium endosymbiont of Epithemia turgida]|uniref:transcriptional repressor LexA n=1 Tax=cyanobacterium endosymbiont of Epithemia turgida TaxID=718217 RepID=UPI0004D1B2D6|nr:transcriptional repressor LexA [cyanobacterium endosymbiont of Epithemia turgida]BAP17776.1 SOS function regulatory protein [cyanobacterium endosymbiont of Epithemia turgida isolate EtSB Lake Yunoko]